RAPEEFRTREDVRFSTSHPLVKSALVTLFEVWPQSVPFAELLEAARARLPETAGPLRDNPTALADALLQGFLANLVELHVEAPRFVLDAGQRPVASPLARL